MNFDISIPEIQRLILDSAMAMLSLALAFALPEFGRKFFPPVERWAQRLARRKTLTVLLIGISAPTIRLLLLPIAGIPQPEIHDEFSYLLAGETFASHRLTNPTPPMWVHFETFHEEFQPTYMSMYPPAQGLVLAAGTKLFRYPWFGVCLSVGAMCAAICWMLQGWFSPGWALYGSMLVVLRLGVFSYWMNSYYGGAVSAVGGALVLGAVPRLMRQVRVRTALMLAFGVAILANSRPFEGFLLCVPVAGALLFWSFGKNHPPIWTLGKRFAIPVLLVLSLTAAAMGYYNWRVFGSPAALPYQVNRATYAVAPVFLWQSPRPEPVYRHQIMRDFYLSYELKEFQKSRTFPGFLDLLAARASMALLFILGPALTLLLIALPGILRGRRRFLILAAAIFFAGLLACAFVRAHYLAPATALVFAILVESARRLRLWSPGGQPVGAFLVRALPCATMVLFLVQVGWLAAIPATADSPRTLVQHFLEKQPGRQLAIVRYGARHDYLFEWVYNAADIDASPVVWAREMTAADNRELLDYYRDRKVWLVEPDQTPPHVSLYHEEAADGQPAGSASSAVRN